MLGARDKLWDVLSIDGQDKDKDKDKDKDEDEDKDEDKIKSLLDNHVDAHIWKMVFSRTFSYSSKKRSKGEVKKKQRSTHTCYTPHTTMYNVRLQFCTWGLPFTVLLAQHTGALTLRCGRLQQAE